MTLKHIGRAIVATILLVVVSTTAARAADPPYILVDMNTGQVLAERQSGELWYAASLTKLMTIYLVFQALADGRLQLASPITFSEHATEVQPARMGFPAGTVITVDNALKMLIVKSANDVALAVAETMGGSEAAFVDEMNDTAIRLGLTGTRFINPHGLPGTGQHSTARDLALLARTIWLGFPQFHDLFAIPEIQYGNTIMPAGNSLLEFYPGTTGMKTGYICAAGFNLVATATRGDRSLLAVVLGADSAVDRAVLAAQLLDAGFAAPAIVNAPAISNFVPRSSVAAPVSLRTTICPAGADGNVEESVQHDQLVAAFGEPPPLPAPVVVYTGGADLTAYLRVEIPLPRPRPTDVLGVAMPVPAISDVPLPRPRPDLF
jgi:D-alanyl-D-alanine carboxypeptidase